MGNTVLGLDLGSNSIGWALLEYDDNQRPKGILACGVRIFQEAIDAKTRTPKNHARRAARAARRLVSRRRRRRDKLFNLLLRHRLLPQELQTKENLESHFNNLGDPYELRKKGLDEPLTLYQFGRVLIHLSQRRGFQSNRKATSDDDGKVKTAIGELATAIRSNNCRTLGEYLASQSTKRSRYTSRSMYQEEFEQLWQAQQAYQPDFLSSALKAAAYNAIFYQRPLKLQRNLVGKCTFEPTRKRTAKAWIEAQRFRILQDLNNLEIKNPITRGYRPLLPDERSKLLGLLERQKTLSWGKARTTLRLHEGETFNLEEGKKKELIGNRTAYHLRGILGANWDTMSTQDKSALITDILTIDNEQGFINRAKQYWGFADEVAYKLATTELEPGYMRLSMKAICAILPYLEHGLKYDKACAAAGYNHSLPNQNAISDKLSEPPYLRNPVVQKALYETRKVVNAIIRNYGKPGAIHIEMARDMKLTRRQKEEVQKQQKAREKVNDIVRKVLQNEFGISYPTRADIQKYQMWQECNMICPYTGIVISREMLFSQEVDVEHILLYPQSLDDSYMNKTLCMAHENRILKHNRTPYEAYSGSPSRYQDILNRIKCLPWPKRRRFEQKEIDTGKFIDRQLNDTRYICVEVKSYLQALGIKVEVSKGEATATLRHRWNLNRILAVDGVLEKNRADHRHHTIDAIVIALTNRALFYKLSRLSAHCGMSLNERGFYLDEPWRGFYNDIEQKIDSIVVSHASSHKISHALHEDTAYGYSEHDKCFVYRKSLASLTANEVEKIRDQKVRALVKKRLEQYSGNIKEALDDSSNPLFHTDGKTPIRTVRLIANFNPETVHSIRDSKGQVYKYFKYGNNHHVEIIEHVNNGKRRGIFVSAMEAAKRARIDKVTVVQRTHGADWNLIMSLSVNDIVQLKQNGDVRYYRVQLLDSSNGNIAFRLHTAATLDSIATRLFKNANTLRCKKVVVDPLGAIAYCND